MNTKNIFLHNDLALAQTSRENAGDTPRSQVTPHVETEREGGCCQQRLVRHFFRVIPFLSLLAASLLAIFGFKVWSVFVFIFGCLVVIVGRETAAKCSRPYENTSQ